MTHDDLPGHEDERLRELAEDYNPPPLTPREAMWEEIEARIAGEATGLRTGDAQVVPIRRVQRPARTKRVPWFGVSGAAAAMVALGFALGRMTGPAAPPAGAPVTVAGAAPEESRVLFTAAAEHLARSGELLSAVRADARSGQADPGVGTWGRVLLLETRMLLGSTAAIDPELRTLLEDLELILAQIALLAEEDVVQARGPEELRMIAEGIETQDVLPRIQAALPARVGS